MIVDVKLTKTILKPKPEDYVFIYTLESYENSMRDTILVLMNSLLTFKLNQNGSFATSVIDFFLFKETLKNNKFDVSLHLTSKCMEVCQEWLVKSIEFEDAKNGKFNDEIITTLKNEPFTDQKSSIAFCLRRSKSGNFCSVGIGKTLSSLGFFNILKNTNKVFEGIIFCLNENKFTWENELKKHTNYSYRIVGNGTKQVLEDLDNFKEELLVVHYDCLINDLVKTKLMEMSFNFVIYDEAHIFKNMSTKRCSSVFEIYSECQPNYCTFLTGTPVSETPMNAFSILKLISPNLLPSHSRFENHFCNFILIPKRRGSKQKIRILNPKNPYKNLDQLAYLMSTFGFRKTHEDVKGFPETVLSVKQLDMEPDQRKIYERIRAETYAEIAKLPEKALNLDTVIVKSLRLRQCALAPKLLGENIESSKFKFLDILLEEILSNKDSKVVIWSSFREALNILVNRYQKEYGAVLYAGLEGGLTQEIRNQNEKRFLEDPKCRIICSITSLGTGKNWGHARTAIYVNEPLRRIELIQSRGRIQRRDAVGTSHIIVLTMRNSVEDWVRGLLQQKEQMSNQIINPDQQLIQKDDFLKGL